MASEHDTTPVPATDAAETPSATDTGLTTATEASDAAADPAPVKRPRKAAAKKAAAPRKRAVKKAAAPAASPVEPEALPGESTPASVASEAPAASEAPGAPDAAEPAPATKAARPARKRASRKAAAPQETVAPADQAPTAEPDDVVGTVSPQPDAPQTSAPEATAPEAAEVTSDVAPTDDAPTDAASAQEPTAPSAFGLVFQPPTPPTRRRRRASAPVGQPTLDAPAAVESPAQVPAESSATEAAEAAEVVEAAEVEAPIEQVSDLRDDAQPSAAGDETDATDDSDDADDAEDSDDSDDADATDQPRRRRRRGGKGRRGRGGAGSDEQGSDTPAGGSSPTADSGRDGRRRAQAPDGVVGAGGADGPDDADDGDNGGDETSPAESGAQEGGGSSRRRTRRRRRSGGSSGDAEEAPNVVTRVRQPRTERDEVTGVKGSTRLEAKKQRRREGREAGRRRTVITEAEFLARRESVERVMVVRHKDDRTQIGVLEDDVLVEHYISRETNVSMAGNIYLGRVQNVLPSMEAAFVDIGKGRNAVLYAGEVNWDAAGLEHGSAKRIENALGSGQSVLVQVTKDPIGHKGARLTSQISLPGRYLVYVPNSSMTGISRKLPDTERARLKKILKEVVPESAGVIVRTAAEGASEEELRADVERLTRTWEDIQAKVAAAGGATTKGKGKGGSAPVLLHGEPDLTVRVIRDVFNEDFGSLVVAGEQAWGEVSSYVDSVAPDLAARVTRWTSEEDLFTHYRIDEQLAKAMDRKVWLPSGGSLVIDRTEAMTVIDVNTGKFVGSGGNLEETVTKNNIEAAEEIVRQLRVRDIGGIIVVDFIDMVLEANRDLVVRRLLECLGRDRTKHQVAEVTSLGLVQMTRKRVGSGLIEVFSENCEHCAGRGIIVHTDPVDRSGASGSLPGQATPSAGDSSSTAGRSSRARRGRSEAEAPPAAPAARAGGPTPAQIAAAAHAAAIKAAEARAAEGSSFDESSLTVPDASGPTPDHEVDTALAAVTEAVEQALSAASSSPDETTPDETGAATSLPAEDDLEPEVAPRGRRQRQPRRSRSGGGSRETAPAAEVAAPAGPSAAEPVTPEPVVTETEAPPAIPAAVAVETPQEAPQEAPQEPDSEPAAPARARRRRGRVVAPAGPPRAGSADGAAVAGETEDSA